MEKVIYMEPELKITYFYSDDIIRTSPPVGGEDPTPEIPIPGGGGGSGEVNPNLPDIDV